MGPRRLRIRPGRHGGGLRVHQALAQTLLTGPVSYAVVADGFLFTTGGSGKSIMDAIRLAGAGAVGAVKYTDIAHGALG